MSRGGDKRRRIERERSWLGKMAGRDANTITAKMGSAVTPAAPRLGDLLTTSEVILAWRGWHLWYSPTDGAMLVSVTARTLWDGPTFVSPDDPRKPLANVQFFGGPSGGVHAMNAAAWQAADNQYRGYCHVSGEVELGGIVVQGTQGFRAEKATIRSLIVHAPRLLTEPEKPVSLDGTDAYPIRPAQPRDGWVTTVTFSAFGHTEAPTWPSALSAYAVGGAIPVRRGGGMTIPPLSLDDAVPGWLALSCPVAYIVGAVVYDRLTRRSPTLQRFNRWVAR